MLNPRWVWACYLYWCSGKVVSHEGAQLMWGWFTIASLLLILGGRAGGTVMVVVGLVRVLGRLDLWLAEYMGLGLGVS